MAYFYLDYQDDRTQRVTNILRSLIAQIVRPEKTLPNAVEALYLTYGNTTQPPNLRTLIATLVQTIETLQNVYIILDALDEYPDKSELLDILEALAAQGVPNLHLLVTSRLDPDIKLSLGSIANGVAIEATIVDSDIRLFVQDRLRNDLRLRRLAVSLKDVIETTIVDGSAGM